MIRFVVRTLGLWSLAGGFSAAVIDGMKSIAASGPVMTSALATWTDLAPGSLAATAQAVGERFGQPVWSSFAATVLAVPTWALFGGLGAVLITLARPRDEKIAVGP